MKLRFIKTSARLSLCQNRKCNYNPRRKKLFRRGLQGLEPVPQYIEAYSDLISAGEKSLYWQMTVDYGRRNMQMYIDWAQSCIEQLEEEK